MHGLVRQGQGNAPFAAEFVEKMVDQQRNVLDSFPQGRHMQRYDAQPIKEVLAKPSFFDFLFQILGRGAEQADVNLCGPGAAQTLAFPGFKHPQQFGLQAQR